MNDKVALDIIRTIAATMDKAVYWIISVAYEVIHDLAGVNIFSDSSNFSMRIYTLIGLFMIFRISFSMINYLINPDSITDKEKGGSNLIKRIVITFALIIFTPYGFNLLSEAQTAILDDNVLPKFFLGESYDTNGARQYQMDAECPAATAENDGQYIALLTIRPFFQLEESLSSTERSDFIEHTSYCKSSSIGELLTMTTYNAPTNANVGPVSSGVYRVNYWFIISTIVGGAIAALMISFCMDVAVRSIKLSFLQIISPVPIISYMDPSQGKSGMFKKWLSEVGKTWADLFLRLGAIFFAVNIISSLENIWEEAKLTDHKFWVFLFIIVGALIFAKKLPSLIENLLGIKLSGSLSFNPLKKLSDEALGGKQLVGAGMAAGIGGLTAVGSVGANLLNNYRNKEKGMWNWKQNLADTGKGLLYGSYYGMKNGYKNGSSGKYGIFKTTLDSVEKSSSERNLSKELVEQGVVPKGPLPKFRYIVKDKYTDVIGYQGKSGTTDEMKDKLKEYAAQKGIYEDMRTSAYESISRQESNASELFKEIINNYNPFDRKYSKLSDDGTVVWENTPLSFDEFKDKNSLSFASDEQERLLRTEYEARRKSENDYREAYNKLLELNKKETKLTKDKEKIESAKAGAKKN